MIRKVGKALTPYFAKAVFNSFLSISYLTHRQTGLSISPTDFSVNTFAAINLHGPHHVVQQSTKINLFSAFACCKACSNGISRNRTWANSFSNSSNKFDAGSNSPFPPIRSFKESNCSFSFSVPLFRTIRTPIERKYVLCISSPNSFSLKN